MPLILPMVQASQEEWNDQRHRVQLGNNTFSFRYRWNSLEKAWWCYLGLLGQEPKVKFKLVNGIDLLAPYKAYDEIPKGSLYVRDEDHVWGRPELVSTFQSGRFSLVYFPDDEDIAAWLEEYGHVI